MPFFLTPIIPQLIYWKTMTSKWIFYSYGNEHFIYWKQPKILSVLFDTENGLLLYSPILLLTFAGLLLAWKEKRTNSAGVALIFPIITYLFASWWAWTFGAAFGHRCYIDYYPVMAFPMAVAIEKIIESRKTYVIIPAFCMAAFFCFYSVKMSILFGDNNYSNSPIWHWNWPAWFGIVKRIF
jgi:hypothetical protein